MGDEADRMIDLAIWDILDELDESGDIPRPKRYRKTKRIVPRSCQKHGNKAFEKATGIKQRWWGLFTL
jgi:hypothetical protein